MAQDDHFGAVSNCSGNVMYKAAGRSFLVNGGAGNNITVRHDAFSIRELFEANFLQETLRVEIESSLDSFTRTVSLTRSVNRSIICS